MEPCVILLRYHLGRQEGVYVESKYAAVHKLCIADKYTRICYERQQSEVSKTVNSEWRMRLRYIHHFDYDSIESAPPTIKPPIDVSAARPDERRVVDELAVEPEPPVADADPALCVMVTAPAKKMNKPDISLEMMIIL